jgi:hypothetical protein
VLQPTGSASLPDAYTYKTLPPVPEKGVPPGGEVKPRQQVAFVVDSLDFHTNLGINNLGESPAEVRIRLMDNNGLQVAEKATTVPAQGMKQINNVIRDLEGASERTGREGYLILESEQPVGAWASQIDNASFDPSLELSRAQAKAASRLLLPSSVSSSRFLTSLLVVNASPTAGAVTIRARDPGGSVRASLDNQPLPARGYLLFEDFYRAVGLGEVFGPIEVEASGGIQLLATERIYTREKTSGYFEGVDVSSAAKTVVLPYAVDTSEFRTNLGVNNLGETPAHVLVSLVDKDGVVLGSLNTSVPPHGLTQLNDINRQLLGSSSVSNREGTLRLEADQPVIGWTSQIDNLTQDPSLVVGKSSTAGQLLIPSTTSVGDFKSSLAVVNLAATPTSVEITARDNDGQLKGSSTVSIAGQGLITYTDILASLGLAGSFGPLQVRSTDGKPLLAVSRVYSTQRTGGYFEGVVVDATP